MNDLANILLTIFLIALLSLPWAYNTLDARTFSHIKGITAMSLVGGCQLQYYTPPAHPENTLVITCPGMEMMRLWPLPMDQPWVEESQKIGLHPKAIGRRTSFPDSLILLGSVSGGRSVSNRKTRLSVIRTVCRYQEYNHSWW